MGLASKQKKTKTSQVDWPCRLDRVRFIRNRGHLKQPGEAKFHKMEKEICTVLDVWSSIFSKEKETNLTLNEFELFVFASYIHFKCYYKHFVIFFHSLLCIIDHVVNVVMFIANLLYIPMYVFQGFEFWKGWGLTEWFARQKDIWRKKERVRKIERMWLVGCRVARWYVFKPTIPIWVNFGGSSNESCW
jgi:hypothetical protein